MDASHDPGSGGQIGIACDPPHPSVAPRLCRFCDHTGERIVRCRSSLDGLSIAAIGLAAHWFASAVSSSKSFCDR